MPRGYFPLTLTNYTPVLKPMPVPEINSATEAPLVCIQISQELVSYLVGLLELYRWPDKLKGTPEQIANAMGIFQDLIVILTEGNCPDCPENPMPSVFRFTEECGMEYSNDNGTTWVPVSGWSTFAENCFRGADGRSPEFQLVPFNNLCQTIQWRLVGDPAWLNLGQVCNGEKGDTGDTGEKGDKGDTGDQGEIGPPGEDCDCTVEPPIEPETGGNNCAGAVGLVATALEILNYNLDQLDLSGAVTDQVLNIITLNFKETLESLPVFGAVIAGLKLSLILGTGSIRTIINNPTFEEKVACWLYCEVEAEGAFNTASFGAWIAKMKTEYAQPSPGYAFIDLIENQVLYDDWARRYAVESLNTDARCDSLCVCDNDRLISWAVATSNAPEGLTTEILVKLTSPAGDMLPADVTVNITAQNGTASSSDYTLLSTFVVFPAGSENGDTIPVSVAIATNDGLDDGETFTLTIESVDGPAVIDVDHDVHTVTITEPTTNGYEWDFAVNGDGGFVNFDFTGLAGIQHIGTHNAGIGWEDTYNNNRGTRGIGIDRGFGALVPVSKVEVDWLGVTGLDTDPSASIIPLSVQGFDGTTLKWTGTDSTFSATEETFIYTPSSAFSINKLRLYSQCGISASGSPADRGGSVTYVRVRICLTSAVPVSYFSGGQPYNGC